MAGLPDLLGGKIKAFLHGAFESYQGPAFNMPEHRFSAPLPQPNSIDYFGPLVTSDQARSYIFNFFGKFTMGKVQVRVQAPYIEHHAPMGFPGFVTRRTLPEDSRCAYADPPTDPTCVDQGRRARANDFNFLDRYVVAEFRNRFADGRAGIKLQAYGVQFQRQFDHLGVLAPIPGLLEGGLSFKMDATSYRTGGAIEGDYELPGNLRLQYGGEAFREFALNDVSRSRQGDGIEATFIGPYNLDRLPLPCPRELDPENPGATRPSRYPLLRVPDQPLGAQRVRQPAVAANRSDPDAGLRLQAAPCGWAAEHR
jgi:hypothetical protein